VIQCSKYRSVLVVLTCPLQQIALSSRNYFILFAFNSGVIQIRTQSLAYLVELFALFQTSLFFMCTCIILSHSVPRCQCHSAVVHFFIYSYFFNPLNPELNPICYFLALLGAHHFLHVSRIRVKLLTFRLLMSYIHGAPILDVSRSHTTTQHSR